MARPKEVIIVLSEQEINRLEFDKVGRTLLANDDIFVLSIDQLKTNKLIENLRLKGLFRRGLVLAKSPYGENSYEEIANASYAFAIEKYMYFSQLCNLLGAKEVIVKRLDKITRTRVRSLNLIALLATQIQEVSIADKDLSKLQSQINIKDVFTGGKPKIKDARALLETKNLLGDSNMVSLLEIKQQFDNRIISRELTLNLSNESKRIIDIAGKIKLPNFLSEITSSFHSAIKNSAEYALTIDIKF